jgi:hypothetical protein
VDDRWRDSRGDVLDTGDVVVDLDAGRAVTRALTGFVTMEGLGLWAGFEGDPGRECVILLMLFNEAELDSLRTLVAPELTLAVGRKPGGERDDCNGCFVGDAGLHGELKRRGA